MQQSALSYTRVKKLRNTIITDEEDVLAAEEPLEIQLVYGPAGRRQEQSITVTMRTPGQDADLATGFLFTEGIIRQAADIADLQTAGPDGNTMRVQLHPHVNPVLQPAQRNFFSNSGCGVCGKADIAAIFTAVPNCNQDIRFTFPAAQLLALPGKLRNQQRLFEDTGGIHAAALFNAGGELLLLKEDIGRHNAVDKLVGAAITAGNITLPGCLLLLSGRAGFELIQKAAMAAIPVITAVGAPSGMAVKMAQEWGITLIGFLREQRCNIYTGEERILVGEG